MDNMRMRLAELEKECSSMRQEIEKLGGRSGKGGSGGWASRVVPRRLGLKVRSQMCSAQESSVSEQQRSMSAKLDKLQAKVSKQKKQLAADA
jgi:APA family basic amino acid/polyamine antiporter